VSLLSGLLVRTQRETPSDADTPGHQLLVRAGFLRAGTLLPLGLRVLRRLEALVRAELALLGAQEVAFGTAEALRESIRSDKQLPLTLFQIAQRRCEDPRPRGGLVRAADYLAADVWRFADSAAAPALAGVADAVFARCGLEVRRCETFDGFSWVFERSSPTEDRITVCCGTCRYAATSPAARSRHLPAAPEPRHPRRKVPTPGIRTVAEQAELLNLPASQIVKTLVVNAGEPVVALVRGDRQVNLAKLARHLGREAVEPATEAEVLEWTGVPPGFVGPFSLPAGLRVVADHRISDLGNFSTGAGEPDMHWVNANWGDDGFTPAEWADLDLAGSGDPCPQCDGGSLTISPGTELAFAQGDLHLSIGLTRTLQTVVERHHDSDGILWPPALAPYQAVVVPVNAQDPDLLRGATDLYQGLLAAGIEAVVDDRDERAGFKFKDADLIGFPLRLTVGRSFADGKVEIRLRGTGESSEIAVSEAIEDVKRLLAGSPTREPVLKR